MIIDSTSDDRKWFKDIITGYPPQVIGFARLVSEYGIEYLKKNSPIVSDLSMERIEAVYESLFSDVDRDLGEDFLSFLSAYGIMPMNNLLEIFEIDERWKDTYHLLSSKSIIRREEHECLAGKDLGCELFCFSSGW